ncbi:MAG: glycosyl hydrolase family 28 protein [Bacteroidota bacterium]
MYRYRILLLTCSIVGITLSSPAQDFNILDFGALPDGKSLNTEAIQVAIDSAHAVGGGRVVVPPGKFVSGSLILKSGVNLHVQQGGTLLGSIDPAHYLKLNRWKGLIMADGQAHIAVTGRGVIDGRGRELALHLDSLFYAGQIDSIHYNFNQMRPKYYLRPQLIEFVQCQHIEVRNVTLKNAACWVQTHHECDYIVIDSVTTLSDAYWNNDGIDIQDCRNVRITHCFVNSADDGICLKSHSADLLCDSIYVANCTVRTSASAIKFGTRSHGGFRNVHIENIKVYDTFRSAIAIESVDGGTLEDVLIENVTATNTGNAIFIRLGKRHTKTVGALRNVVLRNIEVEVPFERPDYAYDIRGPELEFFHNPFPSSITGIPGYPVENVTLENIRIRFPGRGNKGLAYLSLSRLDEIPEVEAKYPEFSMFGELPAWGFYVRHVKGLTLKNIQLELEAPDYRPAFVFDDVTGLRIEDLTIQGDAKPKGIILHNTQEVFVENMESVLKQ